MQYGEIKQLARSLRQSMTREEKLMWFILRNRKFKGEKFNRHEHKLILELNGKIHDYQKEHDKNRDMIMTEKSLNVLRIRNQELTNMTSVLNKIEFYF